MADVDSREVGKAFKVEINGQFLPIKSYSGGDLTAEKAEASSGSSKQSESTMGHNYIAEAIGAKVVALNQAGVAFEAIKKVVANINNSFQFTKKFMRMPIPKLVKNIDYIAGPKPVWPQTVVLGKLGMISGLSGTFLITSAAIVKSIVDSSAGPTAPEVSILLIDLLAYLGLGTGLVAIGLGSYFLTKQASKIGFMGLIFGGLAVAIFIAPFFIQF